MTDTLKPAELDLEALKKVALKATSGPWDVVAYGDGDSLAIHEGRDWRICFMATPGETRGAMERIEANAAHIATFDPPTCLALISRLEALEAEMDEARARAVELEGHMRGLLHGLPDILETGGLVDEEGLIEAAWFALTRPEVEAALSQGTAGSSGAGE